MLFGARPLCSLGCCCRCLLWSLSWVGCSSRHGELLNTSVPSMEVSHRISGHVVRDQYLSEFKNQSGRFMGEASTWGEVWGSQALTQEVPKPVISGDWKQIPKNFCFSYPVLILWPLLLATVGNEASSDLVRQMLHTCLCSENFMANALRMAQSSISICRYPAFPPWQKNIENRMDADRDEWSAYPKQNGKSARLFLHGENYWPCFFWHTSQRYNDDDGDNNQTERPAVILSCPLLQGIKQNPACIWY